LFAQFIKGSSVSMTMQPKSQHQPVGDTPPNQDVSKSESVTKKRPKEIGGPKGLEPTRYGDWEKAGRCIDF
jgi:hypothetical protein